TGETHSGPPKESERNQGRNDLDRPFDIAGLGVARDHRALLLLQAVARRQDRCPLPPRSGVAKETQLTGAQARQYGRSRGAAPPYCARGLEVLAAGSRGRRTVIVGCLRAASSLIALPQQLAKGLRTHRSACS